MIKKLFIVVCMIATLVYGVSISHAQDQPTVESAPAATEQAPPASEQAPAAPAEVSVPPAAAEPQPQGEAAPTPPAEPPATEPVKEAEYVDPAKSLRNLEHPSVAARMGLSDTQRAEVKRFLALRSQELSQASEDKWADIVRKSDQQLFALLTPAQQTLWPKVFSEKTIRMSFRYQGWADVLQWFAEQAGLQLVMDTPPPGTFNYADQVDYTPSEAIDLLNSVLQTKGYTLVRNGKMLMLFNLSRGSIPLQFLPKLKPEDLPTRGRFEYTTVAFALDRRNRTDVLQVLDPFKGPYCQIVLMPNNSLMITDTAGTLLVLQKVMESVNNPAPPAPPAPPAKPTPPPPPVWKTYKVEKNDPGKIEEIFKEFAPTGKSLRIGNSNELHYFLPEAEQEKLADILKMLEEDTGIPQAVVLVSYSIAPYLNITPQRLWQFGRMRRSMSEGMQNQFNAQNPFDPSLSIGKEIIEILKKTFPAAIVSDTPVADNVVVLAPPMDHEKIKTFFDSLKQTSLPEDEPTVRLYRYTDKKKKMSDETSAQLKAVVPTGIFTLDREQGLILAVATVKEHEMLTKAVAELESAVVPDEERYIKTYRLPSAMAIRFSSILRQVSGASRRRETGLMEGIFEIRDASHTLISIWATAEQHEQISKIVEDITGRKTADKDADSAAAPVLRVYPMLRGHAYTAHLVLGSLIQGIELAYDPRTNAVIAVAVPDIQPIIQKGVEELDQGVGEDIAFFSMKEDIQQELQRHFSRIAPHSVVVQNKRTLQIFATGPKQELDKIKAILAATESASPDKEETIVHAFQTASPAAVVVILASIFPQVKTTIDPTNDQLILTLASDMKEPVLALLKQLDGTIEFVPVERLPSERLIQSFQTVAPRATLIVDRENAQVMIRGTHGDVEKIKEILKQVKSSSSTADEILVHTLKHVQAGTVVPILTEIYPDLKIRDDVENDRLVIRMPPDRKEAVQGLLDQLDTVDPDKEKRFFKSYALDTGFYSIKAGYSRYHPVEFITDLQRLAPRAKISFDEHSQQLIVWGTEDEHRTIDTAVRNMSDESGAKKYGRFPLRRIPSYILIPIIQRMYPTVIPTYDVHGQTVIVEGHSRLLQKIGELINTLDPAEPSPNDPAVRFYALNSEPTDVLLQGLQRLVPSAMVVPDKEARQIMVIAKPDEQKIIETNVQAIVATFTAPEEPMLFIYPATQDQRERLEAFVVTAARDLKGVAIVKDKSPNQVSIWAKPSEHQLISAILKQMQENRANEPQRELKVFHMSIGSLVTAKEVLTVSHPDATLFADTQENRLLVWATKKELDEITQTLTVQGSIDSRQMLAYPVAGIAPETMAKVIQDVFSGLKITAEKQTRRVLVWASPEEHVKIAEIIEQANKKAEPDSELAEKFVAYSAANLDVKTILPLFKALIPEADVYADIAADKVTVRARVREHVQIKELLDQLREKDEKLRPILAVYQIGNTDPVMIEVMLRNQLPNAESMTADEIIERISWWLSYERSPFYRRYYGGPQAPKKVGYFKVDAKTQSAFVFVNGDDQVEVAKAMEQLIAAGNQEGVKPVLRRYSFEEMSIFDVWRLLQEVAPSALLQPVYTYNPQRTQGWDSYRMNYRDFLAYARESEQEKIEQLVQELNDRTGTGKREMLSILIPQGSRYSREKIIETIQKIYPDISPIAGGTPNQILIWSTKQKLAQVRKIIDEACPPTQDAPLTEVRSYPLQYISIEDAKSWLAVICPNAQFDAEPVPTSGRWRYQFSRRPDPQEPRNLVVLATPLEHLEIAKAITELDKGIPESYKLVPRIYSISDHPATVTTSLLRSMAGAFPNAVCIQGAEQQTIMAVATEEDHQHILAFLNSYKEDGESKRPSLEVYSLKRQHYYRIYNLIHRIAPQALIFPGSKPDQIAVYGTPKEQLDVSTALARLEMASVETDNQMLKVYKVGGKKAGITATILGYQFSGSMIFAISPDEIIAWSSPVDHESIAKMLDTIAEAYPETLLKIYYFKHVPLGEGYGFLAQAFAGQAQFSVRESTGDLLVYASQDIQDRVSVAINGFDVPRPRDTESLPVAYDLSELSSLQVNYAARSIPIALPGMIVLPSSVSGQLVVWGKLADHEKVRAMVDQMLTERPETASEMQVYTLRRDTAANAVAVIKLIVPQAQFGFGTNPNQLLAWAKGADHSKIANVVNKLNEVDPDMQIETYALKNIYYYSALSILRNMIATQGLDARIITYDYYANQLVVEARSADHLTIAKLLEKLKHEERDMDAFVLETIDPMTAYYAVQTLFGDEPYSIRPRTEVDQSTNTIFIQGTAAQLEKTRRMLINMGETNLMRRTGATSTSHYAPGRGNVSEGNASLPSTGSRQLRVIRVEGDASDVIRELEKRWPQYSPNRLLINREDKPLIQKRDETPPQSPATSATPTEPTSRNETGAIPFRGNDIMSSGTGNYGTLSIFEKDRKPRFDSVRSLRPVEITEQHKHVPVGDLERLFHYSSFSTVLSPLRGQGCAVDVCYRSKSPMGTEKIQNSRHETGLLPNETDLRTTSFAFFSINDPEGIRTENGTETVHASEPVSAPDSLPPASSLPPQAITPRTATELIRQAAPNVYVTVNEDGSLTIASYDTEALDRLEKLLQKINDRVLYEDRDYTIFSVRNVSASLVAMKLQIFLRERLAGTGAGRAFSSRYPSTQLEITADESSNVITVRGSRADRKEVANLINLFDVSELPGQMAVTKPIKVPIRNTQVMRVYQQVMNVYRQKIMATRLPGGTYPRVLIDSVTDSLEILAPEPLASEMKEYAETLDRMTVEEPARKVHIIPLEVDSTVIRKAITEIQRSSGRSGYSAPGISTGTTIPPGR